MPYKSEKDESVLIEPEYDGVVMLSPDVLFFNDAQSRTDGSKIWHIYERCIDETYDYSKDEQFSQSNAEEFYDIDDLFSRASEINFDNIQKALSKNGISLEKWLATSPSPISPKIAPKPSKKYPNEFHSKPSPTQILKVRSQYGPNKKLAKSALQDQLASLPNSIIVRSLKAEENTKKFKIPKRLKKSKSKLNHPSFSDRLEIYRSKCPLMRRTNAPTNSSESFIRSNLKSPVPENKQGILCAFLTQKKQLSVEEQIKKIISQHKFSPDKLSESTSEEGSNVRRRNNSENELEKMLFKGSKSNFSEDEQPVSATEKCEENAIPFKEKCLSSTKADRSPLFSITPVDDLNLSHVPKKLIEEKNNSFTEDEDRLCSNSGSKISCNNQHINKKNYSFSPHCLPDQKEHIACKEENTTSKWIQSIKNREASTSQKFIPAPKRKEPSTSVYSLNQRRKSIPSGSQTNYPIENVSSKRIYPVNEANHYNISQSSGKLTSNINYNFMPDHNTHHGKSIEINYCENESHSNVRRDPSSICVQPNNEIYHNRNPEYRVGPSAQWNNENLNFHQSPFENFQAENGTQTPRNCFTANINEDLAVYEFSTEPNEEANRCQSFQGLNNFQERISGVRPSDICSVNTMQVSSFRLPCNENGFDACEGNLENRSRWQGFGVPYNPGTNFGSVCTSERVGESSVNPSSHLHGNLGLNAEEYIPVSALVNTGFTSEPVSSSLNHTSIVKNNEALGIRYSHQEAMTGQNEISQLNFNTFHEKSQEQIRYDIGSIAKMESYPSVSTCEEEGSIAASSENVALIKSRNSSSDSERIHCYKSKAIEYEVEDKSTYCKDVPEVESDIYQSGKEYHRKEYTMTKLSGIGKCDSRAIRYENVWDSAKDTCNDKYPVAIKNSKEITRYETALLNEESPSDCSQIKQIKEEPECRIVREDFLEKEHSENQIFEVILAQKLDVGSKQTKEDLVMKNSENQKKYMCEDRMSPLNDVLDLKSPYDDIKESRAPTKLVSEMPNLLSKEMSKELNSPMCGLTKELNSPKDIVFEKSNSSKEYLFEESSGNKSDELKSPKVYESEVLKSDMEETSEDPKFLKKDTTEEFEYSKKVIVEDVTDKPKFLKEDLTKDADCSKQNKTEELESQMETKSTRNFTYQERNSLKGNTLQELMTENRENLKESSNEINEESKISCNLEEVLNEVANSLINFCYANNIQDLNEIEQSVGSEEDAESAMLGNQGSFEAESEISSFCETKKHPGSCESEDGVLASCEIDEGVLASFEIDEGVPASSETDEGVSAFETGDGVPASETGDGVPASETGDGVPASSETNEGVPVSSETDEGVSAFETGDGVPASETGDGVNASSETNEGVPVSSETDEGVSAFETGDRVPASETGDGVPASSETNEGVPVSSETDEEVSASCEIDDGVPVSSETDEEDPQSYKAEEDPDSCKTEEDPDSFETIESGPDSCETEVLGSFDSEEDSDSHEPEGGDLGSFKTEEDVKVKFEIDFTEDLQNDTDTVNSEVKSEQIDMNASESFQNENKTQMNEATDGKKEDTPNENGDLLKTEDEILLTVSKKKKKDKKYILMSRNQKKAKGHKDEKSAFDGSGPFKCSNCSYVGSSKNLLKRHEMIHWTVKKFNCTKCSFSTNFNSYLEGHKVIHSDKRPFKCSFCSFASKLKSNLKKHERTHQRLKCFECMYVTKDVNTVSCKQCGTERKVKKSSTDLEEQFLDTKEIKSKKLKNNNTRKAKKINGKEDEEENQSENQRNIEEESEEKKNLKIDKFNNSDVKKGGGCKVKGSTRIKKKALTLQVSEDKCEIETPNKKKVKGRRNKNKIKEEESLVIETVKKDIPKSSTTKDVSLNNSSNEDVSTGCEDEKSSSRNKGVAKITKNLEERIIHCSNCDFKTSVPWKMTKHKFEHFKVKKFKCLKCEFSCNTRRVLFMHHHDKHEGEAEGTDTEEPVKVILESNCDDKISRKSMSSGTQNGRKLARLKTKNKDVSDLTDKMYGKQIVSNPKGKNFHCAECDFCSKTKYLLIKHESVHSGFDRLSNIKEKLKRNKKNAITPKYSLQKGRKKFTCSTCSFSTKKIFIFEKHKLTCKNKSNILQANIKKETVDYGDSACSFPNFGPDLIKKENEDSTSLNATNVNNFNSFPDQSKVKLELNSDMEFHDEDMKPCFTLQEIPSANDGDNSAIDSKESDTVNVVNKVSSTTQRVTRKRKQSNDDSQHRKIFKPDSGQEKTSSSKRSSLKQKANDENVNSESFCHGIDLVLSNQSYSNTLNELSKIESNLNNCESEANKKKIKLLQNKILKENPCDNSVPMSLDEYKKENFPINKQKSTIIESDDQYSFISESSSRKKIKEIPLAETRENSDQFYNKESDHITSSYNCPEIANHSESETEIPKLKRNVKRTGRSSNKQLSRKSERKKKIVLNENIEMEQEITKNIQRSGNLDKQNGSDSDSLFNNLKSNALLEETAVSGETRNFSEAEVDNTDASDLSYVEDSGRCFKSNINGIDVGEGLEAVERYTNGATNINNIKYSLKKQNSLLINDNNSTKDLNKKSSNLDQINVTYTTTTSMILDEIISNCHAQGDNKDFAMTDVGSVSIGGFTLNESETLSEFCSNISQNNSIICGENPSIPSDNCTVPEINPLISPDNSGKSENIFTNETRIHEVTRTLKSEVNYSTNIKALLENHEKSVYKEEKYPSTNTLNRERDAVQDTPNGRKYKCPHCDYYAATKTNLKGHSFTHLEIDSNKAMKRDKEIFMCKMCNVTFSRKPSLKRHMNKKHNGVDTNIEANFYEESKETLGDEKTGNNMNNSYNEASDKLKNKPSSSSIKKVSKPKRTSIKMLSNKRKLINKKSLSLANISERKKSSCLPNEQKKVSESQELIYGQNKLNCPNCDYSTTQKRLLKQHMLSHLAVKRLKCPHCVYRTNYSHRMKHHIQKHHDW